VSERSRRFRVADCLTDILENIERIEVHILGIGKEDLARDGLRRDAVERCIERICEASYRLGDQAEALLPDQAWRAIRGMGNRLRHAYDRVDLSVVWTVVTERLPELKADASRVLKELEADDET
jgi:uncharacterized protein with HEPN domain